MSLFANKFTTSSKNFIIANHNIFRPIGYEYLINFITQIVSVLSW